MVLSCSIKKQRCCLPCPVRFMSLRAFESFPPRHFHDFRGGKWNTGHSSRSKQKFYYREKWYQEGGQNRANLHAATSCHTPFRVWAESPAAGQTTCWGRKQHLSWEQTLPYSSGDAGTPEIPAGGHLYHQTLLLHTDFIFFVCVCESVCVPEFMCGDVCVHGGLRLTPGVFPYHFLPFVLGPIIFQSIPELYRVSLDGHLAQRSPISRVWVFSPQLTNLGQPSQTCPDVCLLGDSRCWQVCCHYQPSRK